jgi:hypothetical protein
MHPSSVLDKIVPVGCERAVLADQNVGEMTTLEDREWTRCNDFGVASSIRAMPVTGAIGPGLVWR